MLSDSVEILTLAGAAVPVRWRRSKRARRVSLRIDPRGAMVIVTLPMRTSRAMGMTLLANHVGWVQERLASLPKRIGFHDGAEIPLYGEPHRVRHMPQMRGCTRLEAQEIHVAGDAEFLPRRLGIFLGHEARRALVPQVMAKAEHVGMQPGRITLKDTSSRWGSCTSGGNLAFSWRLVMAPRFVQDYVVSHEVAHLRHMNHGPQFWKLVGALSPHTEDAMDWLRRDGLQLLRVG